ncbi:hypothetical protein [Nocardioides halotolerans]|uniref:hypothetical protein n=1 Tax=Nocardioides halotolerans TaxID=433660 RepID=UPI000418F466|nr:hypothetical protein [Nocardioides halotolerans]
MTVHAVVAPDGLTATAAVPHDCVVVVDEAATPSGRALARAAAVLEREPSVGTVFIDVDGKTREGVQPGARWLREAAARGTDTVGARCAVLRRATFEAAGQQGLGTRRGELSLWLRAAALADVAHVAEPLPLTQLSSAASPSAHRATGAVGQITELHERARAFHELFEGFAPLRGEPRLRTATYRALAHSIRSRAWVAAYEGDSVEASLCLHLARDVNRWRRQRLP